MKIEQQPSIQVRFPQCVLHGRHIDCHSSQYTALPPCHYDAGHRAAVWTPYNRGLPSRLVRLMTQRLTVAILVAALAGVLAAASLRASSAPASQAQAAPQAPVDQPPVTFRVEVNYVEVDAFVTDAAGNAVTNLTDGDFEVFEDGKPQKVSSFSLVNIPIERAERPLFAGQPIEPDVQTNEHLEGRIYLIVLDDVHTDFTRTPRVKAADAPLHRAELRHQRSRRGRLHRPVGRLAGFHEQPAGSSSRPSTSSPAASCDRRRSSGSRPPGSILRPASSSPATTSTRWIAHSAPAR